MGGADPGAAGFTIDHVHRQRADCPDQRRGRRVLPLKFQLGLFENPYGDPVNGLYRVHTPAMPRWSTRPSGSR